MAPVRDDGIPFAYDAIDSGGTSVRGTIFALREENAKDILSARGLVVTRLVSAHASQRSLGLAIVSDLVGKKRVRRIRTATIQQIVFALYQPLKIGLTISESIRVSIDQNDHGAISKPLRRIQDKIQAGHTLRDAFAAGIPGLPLDALALIEAGERSGQLAAVFHTLNDRLARTVATNKDLRAALIYPTLVLIVGLFVVVILFSSVIPTIGEIVSDKRQHLPASAAGILAFSDFINDNWPAICLVVCSSLLLSIASFGSDALTSARQRLLLRIPLAGPLLVRKDAVQFARALAAQLGGGVEVGRAVRQSASGLALESLRARAEGIATKLSQGWALSDAIAKDWPQLPREVAGFAKIGEQTGRLAEMLEHASEVLDARVRDQARLLSSLVTPVVTILLGLLVGGVVLALMSAIVSLNDVALR